MEMNVSAGQNQQHVSRTVARLVNMEPYDRSLPVFLFERFEGKGLGVDDQRLRVSSGSLSIRHGEDYEWNPGILQTRGKPVGAAAWTDHFGALLGMTLEIGGQRPPLNETGVGTVISRATAAVKAWT